MVRFSFRSSPAGDYPRCEVKLYPGTMYYEAAFKRRGSGKLWWQYTEANSIEEAIKKLRDYVQPQPRKPARRWNLYAGPFEVTSPNGR